MTSPENPTSNAITGTNGTDAAAPSHGDYTYSVSQQDGAGSGTSVTLTNNNDGTYTLVVG